MQAVVMNYMICIYCGSTVFLKDFNCPLTHHESILVHDCFTDRFSRDEIRAIKKYHVERNEKLKS